MGGNTGLAPSPGNPSSDDRPPGTSAPAADSLGTFRYWFDDDRWEWSDRVAALHGYRPGEAVPTTELLRRHKHPDDRLAFDELMAAMRRSRAPFSSHHRIVDRDGRTHEVVVVGRTFSDRTGRVVGCLGFYLELDALEPGPLGPLESLDSDAADFAVIDDEPARAEVNRQIDEFRENRAVIEQAKGMLMLMYGVSGDRAFDVLRWRSQEENRKLRDVCRSLVADARTGLTIPDDLRRAFDNVVLAPFTTEPNDSAAVSAQE